MIPVAVTILIAAVALLLLDVEPVPTWFYVFAWYPTLVIADSVASRRDGGPSLFGSPRRVASVFGWSAVIWLLYEAINLRIANWYYVFLPPSQGWRWLGILASFATVVPAILVVQRLLGSLDVGKRWRSRPLPLRDVHRRVSILIGCVALVLAMAWPSWFWPLVWGVGLFVADPLVYRIQRADSLMADVEVGRWDRIAQLLIGGLAIGLLWETLNYWARGKWIYTVPLLEHIKLFEMPPLGFLGFPIFALSAWSLYHLLCAWKVAAPPSGTPSFAPLRLLGGIVIAVTFSYLTLQAMESRTISSKVPQLLDLPEANEQLAGRLRGAGLLTIFDLISREPREIAASAGISDSTATALLQSARLAVLRGMGTSHLAELNARDIYTVCDLAAADPEQLWLDIHAQFQRPRPTRAEVRVWTRAAAGGC